MKAVLQYSSHGLAGTRWNQASIDAPPPMAGLTSREDLLKRSLLYHEFQAEHEEILRHKWFESERAGRDIGIDQASIDWKIKYNSKWFRERREKRGPFVLQ